MKILVVGGIGYIGSHMLKRFKETNYDIEILDNLSSGQKENTLNYKLHVCDLSDKETVYKILSEHNYDLVMHFAASINVEESYYDPKKYRQNNVINTINLLECMRDLKINKKNIKFTKDESIHTENSHKYSKNNFIKLVNKSGFKVLKYFADKKNYFGVFLLKVK